MKVILECEVEEWWGVKDLIEDMPNATTEEKHAALCELFNEDISSLIENAKWRFEDVP